MDFICFPLIVPAQSGSQFKLHIQRACAGIRTAWRNFTESQFTVHRYRSSHHGLNGVEPESLVTDVPGRCNDPLGQFYAETLAPILRTDIEPLHLTNFCVDFM